MTIETPIILPLPETIDDLLTHFDQVHGHKQYFLSAGGVPTPEQEAEFLESQHELHDRLHHGDAAGTYGPFTNHTHSGRSIA